MRDLQKELDEAIAAQDLEKILDLMEERRIRRECENALHLLGIIPASLANRWGRHVQ